MSEPAEYDRIGDRYSEAKQQPFRIHMEAHTLETLAGDLRGANVVDFACGDGFYSRRLMRAGAARTLGIDASQEMVALGRHAEESAPLGCRYAHGDVGDAHDLGPFDVAIAAYLLNYARTRDELRRFCVVAFESLRPGGRLLGVNDFTEDPTTGARDFTRHGFRKIGPGGAIEGEPITYEFLLPEGRSFAITNYYWKPETYLAELRAAGFSAASWHPFTLSRDGAASHPAGFFDDLMAAHPLAACVAQR
jgi:SAM-dependent methyltransferase